MDVRFLKLVVCSIALAAVASPAAHAAEVVYSFSGTINQAFQFSAPNAAWKFEAGKAFSGTLKIDTSLISQTQNIVTGPGYNFTRYFGAITGLSYMIETTAGSYNYAPPLAINSLAVGAGTDQFAFNGVDIRQQNYPAAFGGTPQIPVPPAAQVGSYTPHATFISLGSFVRPGLLANTAPTVDLPGLHSQLTRPAGFGDDRSFVVRFSDPALWPPGQERIDAIVYGDITSFSLAGGAVPEPATWAMLIAGFGMIGGAMRTTRKKRTLVAA
jgi:PEP-CTERM motif